MLKYYLKITEVFCNYFGNLHWAMGGYLENLLTAAGGEEHQADTDQGGGAGAEG